MALSGLAVRPQPVQEHHAALLPEDAAAAQGNVADEAAAMRLDPLREGVDLRLLEAAVASRDS
jgi:hypothetical protein